MGNTPRLDTVNPPWKIKRIVREAKTTKTVVQDAIIRGELHEVGPPGSGEIDPWEAAEWCAKRWRDAGAPVGPVSEVTSPLVETWGEGGARPLIVPPTAPPPSASPPRYIPKFDIGDDGKMYTRTAEGKRVAVAWAPCNYPQELFISGDPSYGYVDDIFYGGARGGGKSDVCLGDAASRALEYGDKFRAIVFRRSFDELEEIKNRSRQIFGPIGFRFNESLYTWKHTNGAIIYFRYFNRPDDYYAYHGWQIQAIYRDELPSWPDPVPLDRLWSILRSPHGIPCVMRSTGNPGGPGMAWVKKRYRLGRDECKPFEVFHYAPLKERPEFTVSCMFIPSKLDDNPFLMQDRGYEIRLAASAGNDKLFKAWREGDWDCVSGAYFASWNFDDHTYGKYTIRQPESQPHKKGLKKPDGTFEPEGPIERGTDLDLPKWFTRWVSIDWGYAHAAAALWFCTDGEKVYVYREYMMPGLTPTQLAEVIVKENAGDKLDRIVLGHDAFERRTSERTIASEMGAVFEANRLPFPWKAQDKSRPQGWSWMNQMITKSLLRVHRGCKILIESISAAMHDEDRPEDILKFRGDDVLEACRNGLRENPAAGKKPAQQEVQEVYEGRLKETGGDVHSATMTAFLAQRRQQMAELQGILGLDFRGRRPRS